MRLVRFHILVQFFINPHHVIAGAEARRHQAKGLANEALGAIAERRRAAGAARDDTETRKSARIPSGREKIQGEGTAATADAALEDGLEGARSVQTPGAAKDGPLQCLIFLLLVDRGRETMAAFRASAANDILPARARHAREKPVAALALQITRLEGSLHDALSVFTEIFRP